MTLILQTNYNKRTTTEQVNGYGIPYGKTIGIIRSCHMGIKTYGKSMAMAYTLLSCMIHGYAGIHAEPALSVMFQASRVIPTGSTGTQAIQAKEGEEFTHIWPQRSI